MLIKIAERIINLFKVRKEFKTKKVLIEKECVNIYAPLHNRLGIEKFKWELEDFFFRCLYPNEYKNISELLYEHRIDREKYINNFILSLQYFMLQKNIIAEIYGRPKHIYSIWRKMQKKYLAFDKLFDVRAVRIIVEHLQDCYVALNIVHTYFRYLPNEFDDYVVNPKLNGYQSIHTVILGPDNKTIEIQIRTQKMHKNAELGIAAHWKYKEGILIIGNENSYEKQIV
ncbi:MAG: HD domain-containing protein [Arsenophonus sp. ET-YP4-MAG3]